jgi:hypothetical protein
MVYLKNGERRYEVLANVGGGNMQTVGFVMRYCPDGPRWRAVDMQENGRTFSTRKAAGNWLLSQRLVTTAQPL